MKAEGLLLLVLPALSLAAITRPKSSLPSQEAIDAAKAFLDEHPVFDGHNDLPYSILLHCDNDLSQVDLTQDLTQVDGWKEDPSCHTDIPRMREGRLGAQFWSAYIDCEAQYKDAVELFMEQTDLIKRMAADYPDDMTFCTTADEVEAALAEGKVASLIGVESGHAINSNLAMVRVLYDLGVRYMTLTHSCNTPWADAAQVEEGSLPERSVGLSAFGEQIIMEMNRVGMFIDLAHVSADTMRDALRVSRSPVMFSHSSAREVCSAKRNVPDDVLEMLKENGGVVMVNFFSYYLNDNYEEASVYDAVAHLNHIREVCGIHCVGIGGDYNGVTVMPEGLEDVSKYPNLFAALIEDGTWSESEMAQLANGNILRAFRAMEASRNSLASERWYESKLEKAEWYSNETGCMSEFDKEHDLATTPSPYSDNNGASALAGNAKMWSPILLIVIASFF